MLCGSDQKLPCSPFAFCPVVTCSSFALYRETPAIHSILFFSPFNSFFLRHHRCLGRRITLLARLRSILLLLFFFFFSFVFFFFSALDLGGLQTLTIGVSPTRVLVSWCDVCSESALFGQGLMGNKAQSVGGMLFLRGSLDLSFHQARVRTSTHLLCFSQRLLDPRVLFFIGGLWRCFALEFRWKIQASAHVLQLCAPLPTADHKADPPRKPSATMRASLLSVCLAMGHLLDWPTSEPRPFPPRYRKFSRAPPTPSDDSQNDGCIHEYHEPLCSHSLTGDTAEEADQTLDVCAWRCKIDMKTSGSSSAPLQVELWLLARRAFLSAALRHPSRAARVLPSRRPSRAGTAMPLVRSVQRNRPLHSKSRLWQRACGKVSHGSFACKKRSHSQSTSSRAPFTRRSVRRGGLAAATLDTSRQANSSRQDPKSERPASQERLQERPFHAPDSDQHRGEHQRDTAFEGEPPGCLRCHRRVLTETLP